MNAEEALLKMPAKIREFENDLFKQKQALDGMRLRLKLREADVALHVAQIPDPVDPKKKLHTNADARDNATRGALASDAEALSLKKQLMEQEALISRIQSTVDFCRDQQRNARVLILARAPSALIFEDPELAQ